MHGERGKGERTCHLAGVIDILCCRRLSHWCICGFISACCSLGYRTFPKKGIASACKHLNFSPHNESSWWQTMKA